MKRCKMATKKTTRVTNMKEVDKGKDAKLQQRDTKQLHTENNRDEDRETTQIQRDRDAEKETQSIKQEPQ